MGKSIGTAAWAGAEGAALRAAGWWYGGYGTAGVIACAPGESLEACVASVSGATPSQPYIQRPIVPDEPQAATPGITGAVTDKACGVCRKPSTTAPVPVPSGGPSPTAPGVPAPTKKKPFPWWLLILLLIAAKVVSDGRDA